VLFVNDVMMTDAYAHLRCVLSLLFGLDLSRFRLLEKEKKRRKMFKKRLEGKKTSAHFVRAVFVANGKQLV